MDIFGEIKRIQDTYGLYTRGKTFQNQIKEALTESLADLFAHHTVAIKGGGRHTEQLLELIKASGNEKNISAIFDRKYTEPVQVTIGENTYMGYPDEEMKKCKADAVIASSFSQRRSIAKEIRKQNDKLLVFDLYDELERKGLILNSLFYRVVETGYENLVYYRTEYLKRQDAGSLWNYIVACIAVCNFIDCKKLAQKYIENGWEHADQLKKAMDEIEQLFSDIRAKLKARGQRDIVMLWIDQLEYRELGLCPFIESESKDSLFLEKSYSITPFTSATIRAIFRNFKSLESKFYITSYDSCSPENSAILANLDKHGYGFVYIGGSEEGSLFRDEEMIVNYTYGSSSVRCMQMLQRFLDSEKPMFVMLYANAETHSPYLSGALDEAKMIAWPYFLGVTEEMRVEQIRKSALYWDQQWEWYNSFLSDNVVKMYMSDHGKRYNVMPIYKEATTHTLNFIKGKGIPAKRIDKLFSLLHYDKLVDAVLTSNYDEDHFCSNYVEIQEAEIFNDTIIKYYLDNGAEDNTRAFRAIRTQTELYAKLSTGKQFYYLLPDEETDHSQEPEYAERIAELSELAGDYFWSFDGFEDKLKLYRKKTENHDI